MASKTERLTRYGELIALLEDLPAIVRHTRRVRNLSQREAGKQAGVSFTTISRVETGDCEMNIVTAKALLKWSDDEVKKMGRG